MNLASSYVYLITSTESVPAWAKAEHYNNVEQKESFFARLFRR